MKFKRSLLNEKGDLPKLYNYKGLSYSIRDIIGSFRKNNNSKEIIIEKKNSSTNKTQKVLVDKLGKLVNQKGYLVDNLGNIVNKDGKIVFRKHTLLFNEPPKFFRFSEFSLNWILGAFNRDEMGTPLIEFSPYLGGYRDLEGRVVNSLGYLVDQEGNIVDQTGKIVMMKEILESYKEEWVQIPKVFRAGVLKEEDSGGKEQE